jgi:hypothetical protein
MTETRPRGAISGRCSVRKALLAKTWGMAQPGHAPATTDIGDATYVHPPDKQNVGLRLGLLAEAITHGQEVADYAHS